MGLIDTTIVIHVNENVFSLEKTLHAYNNQNYRHFNVIITNSDLLPSEEVKKLTSSNENFFFDITFTNTNKQNFDLAKDYIINTITNLLPGPHFIEEQVKKRELGYYISGVTKKIKNTHPNISIEDIYEERFLKIPSNKVNNEGYLSFWKSEVQLNSDIFTLKSKALEKSDLKQKKIKNKLLCAEVIL